MSEFLSPLRLELIQEETDDQRGLWSLCAAFVYASDLAGRITVPAGFVTDLASVPRLPIAYWTTGGVAHRAAVVHDYLYSTQMLPRVLADAVLREASAVAGVALWRRWLMFQAVRLFGNRVWREPNQPQVIDL